MIAPTQPLLRAAVESSSPQMPECCGPAFVDGLQFQLVRSRILVKHV